MRVFVLCTGRCGSTTLARAAQHATNITAGHETRAHLLWGRLDYPDDHVEVDNRLAWFLGGLDKRYGDDPVYVHLTRDPEETAQSYSHRWRGPVSLVRAYGNGIVQSRRPLNEDQDWLDVSRSAIAAVTENIEAFLATKSKVVHASLPDLRDGFDEMWKRAGLDGDLDAAHETLTRRHNARRRKGRR